MKPEENIPKSGYNYEVYSCPTRESLDKLFQKHKDRAGFYWYTIPQSQGCLVVVATANMEAIQALTKKRTVAGWKILTEEEASSLVQKCPFNDVKAVSETVFKFLIWLYDAGYQVVKPEHIRMLEAKK